MQCHGELVEPMNTASSQRPTQDDRVLYHSVMSITEGSSDPLSPEEVEYVQRAYERMRDAFDIDRGIIAVVFRIGEGGQPSARTRRLAPHIVRI